MALDYDNHFLPACDRALTESQQRLRDEILDAFGMGDSNGRTGLRTMAGQVLARVDEGRLPYLDGLQFRSLDSLPLVHILVEEAPSVLNPARMRFDSVFRDISRQRRRFGIGFGVVSQQVTGIDGGVL